MDDRIEPGGSNEPRPDDAVPPDLYAVKVTGSPEALDKLLRTFELDVGCRHAQLEPAAGRNAVLLVYASRQRVAEIQAAGYTRRDRRERLGAGPRAAGRGRQGRPVRGRAGAAARAGAEAGRRAG